MTKKIGVLRGVENSFPEALVAHINGETASTGVTSGYVALDAVRLGGEVPYDVILDRVSHDVPFYRSFLKWAALSGVTVVNNPFWTSADDGFVDAALVRGLGLSAPHTAILPHKQRPPFTEAATFRNLRFPVDWEGVFAEVGFPAYLKSVDGGRRRSVTLVHSPEQLFAAYDASGTSCTMLQAAVAYDAYFRCACIGRSDVLVLRSNPAAPPERRYLDVPPDRLPAVLRRRLERETRTVCKALGLDVNVVEFAVKDGVPTVVDAVNGVPEVDRASLAEDDFDWLVRTTAEFLIEKAQEKKRPLQWNANGLLKSPA